MEHPLNFLYWQCFLFTFVIFKTIKCQNVLDNAHVLDNF